ncbi:MAG: DMT family transporter [Sedimentitalea sp.]
MSAPAAINIRYGAALLVAAAGLFTLDVTVLRFLSPDVPFAQIIFFRALCQLVIVAIWIGFSRPALFASKRWPKLVVRGVTSLVCWWLYYASFQRLDLALASTLTFTTSLFVVALAPVWLGEKIGAWRWLTTAIGFVGVVLASKVTGLRIEPGVMFGLGSALAAAILTFQNRVLARTEHTATIMFWIALVATLGTLPLAIAGWTSLGIGDAILLIVASTLATVGMLLTVEAYRYGEVSALATFPYVRLLFAIAIGYFVFAELVTPRELIGAAIIVICGLLANEKRSTPET